MHASITTKDVIRLLNTQSELIEALKAARTVLRRCNVRLDRVDAALAQAEGK